LRAPLVFKLKQDAHLAAHIALAFPFGDYVQSPWRDDLWKELGTLSDNQFLEKTDPIIHRIQDLKGAIAQRPRS
jgi:hypothetical protein